MQQLHIIIDGLQIKGKSLAFLLYCCILLPFFISILNEQLLQINIKLFCCISYDKFPTGVVSHSSTGHESSLNGLMRMKIIYYVL